MRRVVEPVHFFPLPDGTDLAPVLNPWDRNADGLPLENLPGASVARGRIPPSGSSRPHLHPVVTQLTWLLEGALRIRMKGPHDEAPYELDLTSGQGALTEPMTFLQLVNLDAARAAQVLYVVTPPYVHLPGEDGYDDAVVFDRTWDQLSSAAFPLHAVGDPETTRTRRAEAMARIQVSRGRR